MSTWRLRRPSALLVKWCSLVPTSYPFQHFRVDYVVGETEELDLMEIIKDQHFNLLPA